MPAAYEKVRDRLIAQGKSPQAAKSEAAAIFNKRAAQRGTPTLNSYVAQEKRGTLSKLR